VRDILIIPTFNRPELLWLCLDYISACPEYGELDIKVYLDAHYKRQSRLNETKEVLKKFNDNVKLYVRQPNGYRGNSYNLMMAYSDAFHSKAEYVFMVEDDVMISSHFFEWHKQAQLVNPVCSVAGKNPGHGVYCSIGVCFNREMLEPIVKHCVHEYFKDMGGYCRANFPPSPFGTEQDGLIARVFNGKKAVWANPPEAQHIGWYGYNRPHGIRPIGNLNDKYKKVKEVLYNKEELQKCVKDFGDIEPLKIAIDCK